MQYSWSDVRSRSANTSTTTLTMKLLVDTKSQRVVLAEAGKDVLDFLFSLLSLPMATVAELVGDWPIAGSIGNLYSSVDELDHTYMQAGADKGALLSPAVSPAPGAHSCPLRLASAGKLNIFSGSGDAAAGGVKGFVQGAVTYTVQDDLTVTPMSNISSINLFNTYAVKDMGDLEERIVYLGYNQGVAILRASLQSKTVLTDVYLRNRT